MNQRTPKQDTRPAAAAWLAGGGEMGTLIRAKEWAQTPLGAIESWPQSLRSAVSILLPSRAQIILFWGPDLVAVYNDAYRPVLGAKHPLALGMPARECFSEAWDVLEPLFMGVMRTGETFWAKDHQFGLERYGFIEETYFDVSYDPVRDETGHVGGLFCIVSDTTGRIVGERRLAALRDLGRVADGAATMGDVLRNSAAVLERYRTDLPFFELHDWNAEAGSACLQASAGITPGAAWPLGGKSDLILAPTPTGTGLQEGPWPEPPTQAAVLRIAAPGKEPYGYLVAGISSRRKFDRDYADFLRLVAANIASAIASVLAFEDERRRAQALAEVDRAKTAFFSNVSHEFRTPLTLMLGPLEELARVEESLPKETRLLVATAQRNGQRLLKLVNTLLEFSRLEAGRSQASFQATDLSALTADLASNFRAACERAGIRLEVDCPPLSEAWVDREMWEKIVLNLLSNAFKFTLEGTIGVRLRDAGAKLELVVDDTGTGVAAEELPRIFERFHRVENARGRSHEGSGIGLALVSELVKLHGGTISVRSEPGEGTAFTIAIPKGSAHLPAEHVKTPQAAAQPVTPRADSYVAEALSWLSRPQEVLTRPAGTPRVLLADDNADLREYARRLLEEHYEVDAVANGQLALHAARARRPDLVISDVMMPNLDGFGLIRELRADPQLQSIPVILLSARAGEEARLEGLASGADDYLVKPFSSRELLVRAGALLKSAEARAQFETLLNEAPLGVYLVDDDFRLAALNPVARPVFGDIPDLIGRDFDEVLHVLWPKPYADEQVRVFRRTLLTGEPHIVPEFIEERLDRKTTEYYEWQVNRIPLPGNRHGVVCYFRDISKAVKAREALREADERKNEFLATLSHELRNPLAPLRSSLEVLKRAGTTGAPAGAAMDIMGRQLNHMVRLVDDLMEISRITHGTFELLKEAVTLDAVLRNALEASEPLIRAGNHRLSVSLPPQPMAIDADPVRLAQVFGNLLNNAAKYSDRGSAIAVTAGREGSEAVVVVSDQGEGIDPEQLPRLFNIFQRGGRGSGRHQSGLGIGLALVRQLVEMHGGRVEVESEGAGKGSRFTVRLPLSAAPPPAAPAERGPEKTVDGAMRILVVDDNRDAAESLQMLLTALGAEVRTAHDGEEALASFAACRPSLILLDIGMPGMDGYEVARRLRALNPQPPVAIVALSGWGQAEDRERSRAAGFDHHMVKPVDFAALQSLIASVQANARPGVA